MIFTFKKFSLIGPRGRIKKVFHLLVDVIPTFQTPAEIETIPMYLDFIMRLNPAAPHYQFTDAETAQLHAYREELAPWRTDDPVVRHRVFEPDERRRIAKTLLELRYLLATKIQQPFKETSLIILERDAPPAEPLIWPVEVVVVLDHLRTPFNVGAILRTMECVGLKRVVSLGFTPRADSKLVQRSAMGCEAAMQVEYAADALAAVTALQAAGFRIFALETTIPSTSVFELAPLIQPPANFALVVGSEEFGVDEAVIAIADHRIHIPTFGRKNSLNVSIAFSIAIYQFWHAIFQPA